MLLVCFLWLVKKCCYFRCIVVPRIVFPNPCLILSKNLILSFIDKVTTGTKSLALFAWNVTSVVFIAANTGAGGLVLELQDTAGAIGISDFTHSFSHDKSSSISQ